MDPAKRYSKQSFWTIMVLSIMAAAGLAGALYYGLDLFLDTFSAEAGEDRKSAALALLSARASLGFDYFFKAVLPGAVGICILTGLFFWVVLKLATAGVFKTISQQMAQAQGSKKGKKDFVDQKLAQERKRRLFLHTLSVLQREGRLLDFFDENLADYDDEQIGAAVRGIHEDCAKVIKKYINPKPVLPGQEGESVTIEKGFDIDAVNLVGKVSGEPPFEGRLVHPGWKAGKREVPRLSDIQDSAVITPAEVEIG